MLIFVRNIQKKAFGEPLKKNRICGKIARVIVLIVNPDVKVGAPKPTLAFGSPTETSAAEASESLIVNRSSKALSSNG